VAGTGMQHNTMWRHLDVLVQVCKVLLLPELNAFTATAPTSPALQLPRLECR
jgi:hypothetical protein